VMVPEEDLGNKLYVAKQKTGGGGTKQLSHISAPETCCSKESLLPRREVSLRRLLGILYKLCWQYYVYITKRS
jgi:hypothetical protein